MEWSLQYPKETQPTFAAMTKVIASPLWEQMHTYLQTAYKAQPTMAYSGCGMQPGWNIKYQKGGKALCTLYPMEGYFICLVVIGQKEKQEAELLLPALSEGTRAVYDKTKEGMGQRWLMLPIKSEAMLKDAWQLMALRREPG